MSTATPFDLRVFISSTFADLQEYRQAAFEAIQGLGARGDDMVYWSADERSGTALSLDRVRGCDVLILIVAHRYGHVPEGHENSVTEQEYLAARAADIPVLGFLLDPSQPWPPDRVEWAQRERLEAFRRRVEAEVTRKLFRTPDELGRLVTQSLASLMTRRRAGAVALPPTVRSLRLEPVSALRTEPDAIVPFGTGEDGLPLALQVRRSRDLQPHLAALDDAVGGGRHPLPTALLSSFRQTLESHAREVWAGEQIERVQMGDGSSSTMFVTRSNLAELFGSSLSLLLASSAGAGDAPMPSRRAAPRTAISAVERSVPAQADGRASLQSEGGRNRFLGLDLKTGQAHSVGRTPEGWVQWRPFVFESLGRWFPQAEVGLGEGHFALRRGPARPLDELPAALMALAGRAYGSEGWLAPLAVSLRVPRQQVAQLLPRIAAALARRHAAGVVHGDLKPDNVLLGADDIELIDDFGNAVGTPCPGWTPGWSAPEQVLGEPAQAASDFYPLGRLVADLVGGELVGEVRKYRARASSRGSHEFDIFFNPSVRLGRHALAACGPGATAWKRLAETCLRFAPAQRPGSADEIERELAALVANAPLEGHLEMTLPGDLHVCTLLDGSAAVGRVLADGRRAAGPLAAGLRGAIETVPGMRI